MTKYTRWFSVNDDGPPVQSGFYDWRVPGVARGNIVSVRLEYLCGLSIGIVGNKVIDVSDVNYWRGIVRPCPRCKTPMEYRKNGALAQTAIGSPDELGGDVVTMSPGGPGKLIDCAKCPACGNSEGA